MKFSKITISERLLRTFKSNSRFIKRNNKWINLLNIKHLVHFIESNKKGTTMCKKKEQKYRRFDISKKFSIFPTFLRLSTFYVVTVPTGVNFHI